MEEPSLERETEREDSLQKMKQRLNGLLNSSASYKPIVSASPSQAVLHVLGNNAQLGQYYFNQRKELRSHTTPRELPFCLSSYKLSRGQRTRLFVFPYISSQTAFTVDTSQNPVLFLNLEPLQLLLPEVIPFLPASWQCANSAGLAHQPSCYGKASPSLLHPHHYKVS